LPAAPERSARRAGQRVEQTGFADIRFARDGDPQSFPNHPAATRVAEQCARPLEQAVEARAPFAISWRA